MVRVERCVRKLKYFRKWQNQQNGLCTQRILRSAWACDQSSPAAWRNLGSLASYWARSKDWSDWANNQADLSLRLEHRSFCWFLSCAGSNITENPVVKTIWATPRQNQNDATSEDSDQPGHSSSLIRVFTVSMTPWVLSRATENRFFAGSDRFLVCKTDSICIKRIFFGPKKKTHFADHILAQFPGLVKCQTVNCP